MDKAERFRFEVRAVLVTWRGVMRQVRTGLGPDSRQAAQRVTALALALLSVIGTKSPELGNDAHAIALLREAREEIHGATFHDLADARELNA
jgi:hypothetical protein